MSLAALEFYQKENSGVITFSLMKLYKYLTNVFETL